MSDGSNNGTEYGTSKGLFGETDRESGEYHFRNGYTQQVYSNAHFVPVDESTVPPKYYRPSEKSAEKSTTVKIRKKKGRSGFAVILVLCLLSGMIGGAVGFALSFYFGDSLAFDRKQADSALGDLEQRVFTQSSSFNAEESEAAEQTAGAGTSENPVSIYDIYDMACSQVVSISVDIVNYDIYGNQIPSVISGSGFILSDDGYILTNYHVVEEAVIGGFNVTVTTYDGTVYVGRIAGSEEDSDVAVIKIEADGLTPVTFGSSEDLRVGDEVYAVGNPYGILEFTMTAGRISALDRTIATEEEEKAQKMFQIDAAVYSGNSGGPVYNAEGEVVGIVTAKYVSSGMEGIGFALPINDVIPVVNELIDKGYVSGKASLGLTFDSRYNTIYSRYYRLPEGAFVSGVAEGSCAAAAGIQPGDILMQIGDYMVEDYEDVRPALRNYAAGDKADILFYRNNQIYTVSVVFDEAIPASTQNQVPGSEL